MIWKQCTDVKPFHMPVFLLLVFFVIVVWGWGPVQKFNMYKYVQGKARLLPNVQTFKHGNLDSHQARSGCGENFFVHW